MTTNLLKDLEKLLRSKGEVDLYIKVSEVLKIVELLELSTTSTNLKIPAKSNRRGFFLRLDDKKEDN